MRVIAGHFRSRPLRSLAGSDVRPTSDRLRETLFNVLTSGNPQALDGSRWLDLYAGSGAIGIEALSRGAHSVTFVEASKRAAAVIRANLYSIGIKEGYEVLEQEATRALRRLDMQAAEFDYCFLDPPYRLQDEYTDCLGFLSQSRLLTPASVVIAEHTKKYDPPDAIGALRRSRRLVQGDAALSFYSLQ